MRIAFVSTIYSYPWGGADALWTACAEFAIERGDDVLIAIAAETADHPRIHELKKKGARIQIRRPLPKSGGKLSIIRNLRWKLSGGSSMRTVFGEWKPERIIINQGGPLDYIHEEPLLSWAQEAGVPFELICQSNSDMFSVSPYYFDSARKWALAAKRFWFVSKANQKLTEIQLALKLPNARQIQNPMEIKDAQILPWPDSPPWSFAVVARMDTICKGFDILFSSLKEVMGDKKDWTLSLYGRGRDDIYLKELAKFLQIDDRIKFAGYSSDVREIWRKHHILLLPSRWEGCALAMLEAMACGRPVLATTVGGAGEWIADGIDGFLCRAATVDTFSYALEQAWKKRAEWQHMGEAAARRFNSQQDPSPQKTLLESI
ncbi:MAG: glycosyltransferase family 4 protein [Chthoniobacterales bacterium]